MKTPAMAAFASFTGLKNAFLCARRFHRSDTHFQSSSKKIIFSIACALFVFSACAQITHSHKKENFDVHEFQVKTISIPLPENQIALVHIGGIKVIDARADTGRVGFMQKKVVDPISNVLYSSLKKQTEQRVNKRPTFICLRNGVEKDTRQFVKNSLAFPGRDSLPGILMVIKKLWLSDELNIPDASTANEKNGRLNRDRWTSGIDIKIEFYLGDKTGYYPLYRYDSVISEAMTISEHGPEFIATALQLSLVKMAQMDNKMAVVTARRKFSLQEIDDHNNNEYNIAALKDTLLKKGVYRNFEEFKNNTPSQVNFEIKKDKLTDIVYVKQPDGKEYPARDIWGYSNGKGSFVKAGDNFFLLQRLENAFYVFGAKNVRWEGQAYPAAGATSYSGASYAILYYKNSRWELQLKPFILNWNTGLLY